MTSHTCKPERASRRVRAVTRHELLRRQAGYSVSALAAELGFSHSYVSLVEGGTPASARYRRAVVRVLDEAEGILFDEDGRAR
jgi:transcriptional regulator with XRE-family HTH domain